jgi:hypothetical protein
LLYLHILPIFHCSFYTNIFLTLPLPYPSCFSYGIVIST